MESQATNLRIRAELERNNSKALHNIATRRAVLDNWVAKIFQSLLEPTDVVVGFDKDIAVAEPWHTEEAESNQRAGGGTKTGCTKDLLCDNFSL